MFKFAAILFMSTVLLYAYANPQDQEQPEVKVISELQNNDGNGNFQNSFETSNGIKVQNEGHVKAVKLPTYDSAGNKNGETDGQAIGLFFLLKSNLNI